MNIRCSISTALILCAISCIIAIDEPNGYYWEYYVGGSLPRNAIIGGRDDMGRKLFIARGPYKGYTATVPGYLKEHTESVVFAMEGAVRLVEDGVEVLVSDHPENFEWILTNASYVRMQINEKFVRGGFDEGGFDNGYALLVGRKLCQKGICLGNVRLNKEHEGMAYALDEKRYLYTKDNFYALAYSEC